MILKRLTKQVIRILIVLFISIALLIFLIAIIIPKPPVKEFNTYHKIIDEQGEELLTNPNETFSNAEFFRNEAYNEWQNQNTKCIIKRDYSESKRMILMAISFAEEATKNMKNNKENNIHTKKNELMDNTLYHFTQRVSIKYPIWNKWIREAILYSKEKKTVVLIIDKFNHNCLVIDKGVQVADFLVEMGINYLNDKQYKGDFATAEGCYYITGRKANPETFVYKSLYLNYPNEEDSIRFENVYHNRDMANLDVLSEKLTIHGKGGKGYDWTDGSIALADRDIDSLFNLVKIGTRVIIVGSTEDINNTLITKKVKD